jgi:hypothetical protein
MYAETKCKENKSKKKTSLSCIFYGYENFGTWGFHGTYPGPKNPNFEARILENGEGTELRGGGGVDSNNLSLRRDFSFRQEFSGNSNPFE